MKHITIATVLALVSWRASAQSTGWSLALSGGASLPLGQFASTHPSAGGMGFAQPGPDLHVQITCPVYQHVGVDVLLGYQENPYNGSAAITDGGFPTNNPSYKSWMALAGPSYRQPLDAKDKWAVSARFLMGVQFGNIGFDDNPPGVFSYDGGLGIQYAFVKHWFLQVTADFVGATYREPEVIGANGVSTFYNTALLAHNTVDTNLGVGVHL